MFGTIKTMKLLVKLVKNRLILVAFGLILMAAAVCALVRAEKPNVKPYFRSRLASLQTEINGIKPLTEPNSDVAVGLDKYTKQLTEVDKTCRELTTKAQDVHDSTKTGDSQSAVENTAKLCQDLIDVVDYSLAVYQSCRDYLLLDQSYLAKPDSSEFKSKVKDSLGTLNKTEQTLQKINYPQVNDPAQPELIKLVDQDQKLTAALAEVNSESQADTLAAQLSNSLTQDKSNFMNARIYYWDNTVGISQLEQSISRLIGLFN